MHFTRGSIRAFASVISARLKPNLMEVAGALMVALLAATAIGAPYLAPYDPAAAVANSFGDPAPPSRAFAPW